VATSFPREIVKSCMIPVSEYLVRGIGRHRPLLLIPAQTFAFVLILGLPQVVFALIGGLLSRKFVITTRISGRQTRTAT
jgi:hypothetical protein